MDRYGPHFRTVSSSYQHVLWEALDFVRADDAILEWLSGLAHAAELAPGTIDYVVTLPESDLAREYDSTVCEVERAYEQAEKEVAAWPISDVADETFWSRFDAVREHEATVVTY